MFKRSLVVLGKCQSLRSSVSPLNQRVMTYATKRPTPTNVSASFMPAKSAHEMEEETDEEFDRRYYEYLSRPDIDGWEIRKALNDLMGLDLIPEPKIIEAAFRAARRLNDHSICVRYLEAIKWKAHVHDKEIYPWIIQELQSVMDELGISTPEDLGYDKPEFALPAV